MDHASNDDVIFDPTSIARCRELLGDEGKRLSDHDVDRVCRHADAMANVIVELFLQQHETQEQPE
jgi:hypothetical protein